jgi:ABC-type sugar transport system permease subunit
MTLAGSRLKRFRLPRRPAGQGEDSSTVVGGNAFTAFLFTGPAVALVGLVLAYPVLYAFWESLFTQERLGGDKIFVGLGNYATMMADSGFWSSLARSGVFIAGSIILGQTLAIIFAFALFKAVKRLRFLRAATILPYIVSSVAAAVMFRIVFNRDFGPASQLVELFGIDAPGWLVEPWLAMFVCIVCQVWTDTPLSVLMILGGLQTIDPQHLDAALVDGASGWKRARYISVPLIAPQLALSTIWLSYACLTSLSTILALTGGGPGTATQTLPLEMYYSAFRRLDMPYALAIANVILFLNVLLTLVYAAVARRFGSRGER